jgi:hypothetical protein
LVAGTLRVSWRLAEGSLVSWAVTAHGVCLLRDAAHGVCLLPGGEGFYGTLAATCLDFDFYLRDGVCVVSVVVFAGVCVGAGVAVGGSRGQGAGKDQKSRRAEEQGSGRTGVLEWSRG